MGPWPTPGSPSESPVLCWELLSRRRVLQGHKGGERESGGHMSCGSARPQCWPGGLLGKEKNDVKERRVLAGWERPGHTLMCGLGYAEQIIPLVQHCWRLTCPHGSVPKCSKGSRFQMSPSLYLHTHHPIPAGSPIPAPPSPPRRAGNRPGLRLLP